MAALAAAAMLGSACATDGAGDRCGQTAPSSGTSALRQAKPRAPLAQTELAGADGAGAPQAEAVGDPSTRRDWSDAAAVQSRLLKMGDPCAAEVAAAAAYWSADRL